MSSIDRSRPAVGSYTITPSDTVRILDDINITDCRSLLVTTDGVLVAEMHNQDTITLNVLAGEIYPFEPKLLRTATTAQIKALW